MSEDGLYVTPKTTHSDENITQSQDHLTRKTLLDLCS